MDLGPAHKRKIPIISKQFELRNSCLHTALFLKIIRR